MFAKKTPPKNLRNLVSTSYLMIRFKSVKKNTPAKIPQTPGMAEGCSDPSFWPID
jgi:hypothetical protein